MNYYSKILSLLVLFGKFSLGNAQEAAFHSPCYEDRDCMSPYKCLEQSPGFTKVCLWGIGSQHGSGDDCINGRDCSGGNCNPATLKCEYCTSEADCNRGDIGFGNKCGRR